MTSELYPGIPSGILDAIKAAGDVVVIGHSNPDGDCIHSQLATANILTRLGKKVTLLNDGPFARNEVKALEPLFKKNCPAGVLEKTPLVIVVDCSTPDRPGECIRPLLGHETIVLDHHSAGVPFTDPGLTYIVPASVSTTMIIDVLREALGLPLDRDFADHVYRGFATDTGFFHFINERNGEETLRRIAAIVGQGISPYDVFDEMHDGRPLAYFKAVASFIDRVESYKEGRILLTWQGKAEVVDGKPADDIYAQLLQVAGVKVVVFLKEREGFVECGLRSKNGSGIDIGAYAATLGGGGHRYAAGAQVDGSLDDVKALVIEGIGQLVDKAGG